MIAPLSNHENEMLLCIKTILHRCVLKYSQKCILCNIRDHTRGVNTVGKIMKKVNFFSDQIEIDVKEATHPHHLKIMSIQEFSEGQPVSLEAEDALNGILCCRREDGAFISGKEHIDLGSLSLAV